MRVTAAKEIGNWVVRLDGEFIDEFWSEKRARRIAMRIQVVLDERERSLKERAVLDKINNETNGM